MKENRRCAFAVLILLFSFFAFYSHAYAGDESIAGNIRQIKDTRQYSTSKDVGVTGTPRGELMSSVDVRLTDKGHGTLGIYADLLCHQPVKQIRIWLYLEKWIPEDEDWASIGHEQFTWNSEDFPDEDLTMAVVSYDIPKLERGQDYRIRGLFGADSFTPKVGEMWSLNTPDFFLE